MRERVSKLVDSSWFQYFIIFIIICNAVTLGLETAPDFLGDFLPVIQTLDAIFLAIFTVELVLKFYAYRFSFFKSGWNNFDLVIVAVSYLPFIEGLSVLRALRILRVLRLVSVIPQFRQVTQAFFAALSGLASVGAIMALIFYIGAVMATKLFGESFPEWFGNIGASLFSLFQVMTLESWSMGIARPVMEVYPYAWLFFIPFILATTFAALNLLIGVIVNSMQLLHDDTTDTIKKDLKNQDKNTDQLKKQLESIEKVIQEMKKKL